MRYSAARAVTPHHWFSSHSLLISAAREHERVPRPPLVYQLVSVRGLRGTRARPACVVRAAARRAGDMRAALFDKTNVFITKNQEARRNLGPRACASVVDDRRLSLSWRAAGNPWEKESASERRESSPLVTPVARSPTVHHCTRPASQSPLSLPTHPAVSAARGENLTLGSLRHFSCLPSLAPARFPSGPREGVDGVLSEGWRCQAPVAARTSSTGILLSFAKAFSRRPPSRRSCLVVSLSRVPSIEIEKLLGYTWTCSVLFLFFFSPRPSVISEDVYARTNSREGWLFSRVFRRNLRVPHQQCVGGYKLVCSVSCDLEGYWKMRISVAMANGHSWRGFPSGESSIPQEWADPDEARDFGIPRCSQSNPIGRADCRVVSLEWRAYAGGNWNGIVYLSETSRRGIGEE